MMKDMAGLLKQAQKMQTEMARIKEELEEKEVSAESGAGMVKATVNGAFKLIDLKIEKTALNATKDGDIEMLEDLIIAAVNEATRRAQELVQVEMAKAAGGAGLDMSALGNMFGGGGAGDK